MLQKFADNIQFLITKRLKTESLEGFKKRVTGKMGK